MPSKYPILTPKEVINVIERKGFWFVSQKGSHRKYTNGSRITIVPMHGDIPKGTLKSIIEQTGLDLEEFVQ